MTFHVYILYAESIDKFYVGYTGDTIQERLRKHLTNHKGYTARAKDWVLCYFETFDYKSAAIARELEIKSKKSRKYIERLIQNQG